MNEFIFENGSDIDRLHLSQLFDEYFKSNCIHGYGDVCDGVVMSLVNGVAIIDVGGKFDCHVILKNELPSIRHDIVVGQTIQLIITEVRSDLMIGSVSKLMELATFKDMFSNIGNKTVAFNGKVVDHIPNVGYHVSVNGVIAFMPGSAASMNKLTDQRSILGCELIVMPINFISDRGMIVVSHREYLVNIVPTIISQLNMSDLYSGTVTGIQPFGIFIQFNSCLTGMIHVNNMNHDTVSRFRSDKILIGDVVQFKIRDTTNIMKIVLTQV
jgi:ribosomal protein S1